MSDNVVQFPGLTCLDLPPDRILENNKGVFEHVLLIGQAPDGGMRYCASFSDIGQVLVFMEKCKRELVL